MKRNIFFIAIVLIFSVSGFSQQFSNVLDCFNENLSSEERSLLERGEVVIRSTNDFNKLCLNDTNYKELEHVRQIMQFLEPNYFAEVIYVMPCEGNENLCDIIEGYFKDVPSYRQIPFYLNDEKDAWKPLFSVAEKLDETSFQNRYVMNTKFRMKPLSKYTAKMDMERGTDSLVFTHANTSRLTVWGITVIKEYKCLAGLAVVRVGDNYLIYGAGGANAWKPENYKEKLEKMFSSRISDFMTYYVRKLTEEKSKEKAEE